MATTKATIDSLLTVEVSSAVSRVAIITMINGENRVNPMLVSALHKALDHVESLKGVRAVVLTATGKFFSNGLDLQWLGQNGDKSSDFMFSINILMIRLIMFKYPTVCAVNGHGFGLGFFLPLCCDYRIMNADKGFMCAPELHIGLPMGSFVHVGKHRLSEATMRHSFLLSKRWSAKEALKWGLIEAAVPEAELLSTAVQIVAAATQKEFDPTLYTTIKREMYGDLEQKLLVRAESNPFEKKEAMSAAKTGGKNAPASKL